LCLCSSCSCSVCSLFLFLFVFMVSASCSYFHSSCLFMLMIHIVVKELSIVHIILSLGTTADWLGGIIICNWYLVRLSISKCSTTTSMTKYWL
jgi:hypothetical protein